ncbi:MAG: 4-hydroxythreonine-4-phosphate dehydrogenase PdxA [Candidatus Omnitrophota bacterium]|nr:4-hydroxythreonine-4-phosphate dehydrogenase PdxA [Candidatus Omnitrophota bacterium]
MQRLKYKIRVGITMGDPAGIGPEIIPKALKKLKGLANFVIIGDKWVFGQLSAISYQLSALKFIDLNNVPHKNFKFGKIKAEYGKASVEYIDKAIELIKNKQIDCLVTCPISKEAVSLAGFDNFTGHTEYLSARTNTKYFAMMLLNRKLKFSLVTGHIPLKDVPSKLDTDKIYKTVLLAYRSLKQLFLIKNPRMAVCGLNPHASDNGLLGEEENKIIKPALKRLRLRLRDIDGTLSADVAVLKAAQKKYDCIIAMYHDQALIPLKLSDEYAGVNLTLGLPFIRTSPLHGTAFDISGRFNTPRPEGCGFRPRSIPPLRTPDFSPGGLHLANATSLIEAIKLAVRCTLNQRKD